MKKQTKNKQQKRTQNQFKINDKSSKNPKQTIAYHWKPIKNSKNLEKPLKNDRKLKKENTTKCLNNSLKTIEKRWKTF